MRLRVAILGFGSIGRRHLTNLINLGVGELSVFDPFAIHAIDVPYFSNLKEVWEWEPNVVFVTAPTEEHCELAIEAAQHKCHLFIEKPISHNRSGLEILKNEVHSRALTNMVACNMRFHPAHSLLHQKLNENTIGEILSARFFTGSYLPTWRPNSNYRESYSASEKSGGAILDCIHELDLALWHLGSAQMLAAVHRPASSLGLSTDGLAELLLTHRNGVLSSIHLNFIQRDYRRGFEVIGSKGTLRWDWKTARVEQCDENGDFTSVLEIEPDWNPNQMYLDEITHFLQAIREGKAAYNTIEEAIQTLEIALKAREGKNKQFGLSR